MSVFDVFTAVAMFLIGAIVGAAVTWIADFAGVAGWIAGLVFAVLVFALICVNDRLMGFEMKSVVRLVASLGSLYTTKAEADEVERTFTRSSDYYAFLAGAILGIAASLLWSPSSVLGLIQVQPPGAALYLTVRPRPAGAFNARQPRPPPPPAHVEHAFPKEPRRAPVLSPPWRDYMTGDATEEVPTCD